MSHVPPPRPPRPTYDTGRVDRVGRTDHAAVPRSHRASRADRPTRLLPYVPDDAYLASAPPPRASRAAYDVTNDAPHRPTRRPAGYVDDVDDVTGDPDDAGLRVRSDGRATLLVLAALVAVLAVVVLVVVPSL